MRMLAPVLAMLAGCAAPAAAPEAPSNPEAPAAPGLVSARLGETVRLGDIMVRPIAVVEDSRCPRDVQCVWAGRLRLRAAVSRTGEIELILGQPFALAGGVSLTLVTAEPAPWHRPPPGVEAGPATRFAFRRD